jgi:CRP-like cAMP-binding protein
MTAGGLVVRFRRSSKWREKFRIHSVEADDPPSEPTNRILAALPSRDASRVLQRSEGILFPSSEVLFRPGELARYVYFPQQAVISLLATMEDGRSVEVGLIGVEGILGLREFLGAGTYQHTALVEIPGSCLRMEMEKFKSEFARGGMIQARSLGYLRYLFDQISQTAACNRLHRVRQRLARHLLMIQDRVRRDEFPMTHESLSYVLGTPRSEVSFAAESLRRLGSIAYERGIVTILNREKLQSASCECYGVIHREFLSLG